jgi:hypothetical protein
VTTQSGQRYRTAKPNSEICVICEICGFFHVDFPVLIGALRLGYRRFRATAPPAGRARSHRPLIETKDFPGASMLRMSVISETRGKPGEQLRKAKSWEQIEEAAVRTDETIH